MQDIRDELANAADLVCRGRTRFDDDWVLQRAGKDIIETIGEAIAAIQVAHDMTGNAVPEPYAELAIPWQALKRMRDRTTHGYREVDWGIVWETLATELPAVQRELDRITGIR